MSACIHEIDNGATISSGFVDPRCEQSYRFGIIEFESASFTFFGDFAGHVDKESFLFVRRRMHGLRLGREYFGSVSVWDYPKNIFTRSTISPDQHLHGDGDTEGDHNCAHDFGIHFAGEHSTEMTADQTRGSHHGDEIPFDFA